MMCEADSEERELQNLKFQGRVPVNISFHEVKIDVLLTISCK
jgi:hypothetical protein